MCKVAIITARGGSKRIPHKNIKEFCGRPIIAYSIQAALSSGLFDEVMVSTDSDEIAKVAMKYGAKVPFMRSRLTSDDYATTSDVIEEVLGAYEARGTCVELFMCLYPTAPFVTKEKLAAAMEQLERAQAPSLVAVTKYAFAPQRAFVIRDGQVSYLYPENERVRSQDLEPLYHDCGQFYICRAEPFRRYHSLVMPGSIPFMVPEEEVQDIDTEKDWQIAEMKYKMQKYNNMHRDGP